METVRVRAQWHHLSAVVVGLMLLATPTGAETLVFKATAAGQQTLDEGEGGGNPFASALIELLGRPALRLAEMPAALQGSTAQKSRNFQSPDVPATTTDSEWPVRPRPVGESRVALVMVVADYAKSGGAPSLPGALHDAGRVAAAIEAAGFATEVVIDFDLMAMRRKLSGFRDRSRAADAALIYVTGHGVEVAGRIHLMPGDYPVSEGNPSLAAKALPLDEIAAAAVGRRVNLLFYGGCRDDPMAP